MVQGLTITICARGGSKRLPNKNILQIKGLTLLDISIKQALEVVEAKSVIFSSDSAEYLNIAEKYNVNLHNREPELAGDTTSKIEVFKKIMQITCDQHYIDLDVTAPLRNTDDINGVYDLLNQGRDIVFGASKMESINPYFNMIEIKKNNRIGTVGDGAYFRSQDAPPVYFLNGIIGWKRQHLLKNNDLYDTDKWGIYKMKEYKMYDIDTYSDYLIVKALMENLS